jgi:hypothetical protein
MDRIGTDVIVKSGGNFVRFTDTGTQLFVWIKAQIDQYALEQQWIFNTNGRIDARLFSSGLQCVRDHRHHPYWRIDADINQAYQNEIRVRYDDGRIFYYANEFNRNRAVAPTVAAWIFRNGQTGKQLTVTPAGRNADSFAPFDFYGRMFHQSEYEPWASSVGVFDDQGDLLQGSNNNEVIGPAGPSTDVVGWYVGHLFHAASSGSTQQLSVGPSLLLQ